MALTTCDIIEAVQHFKPTIALHLHPYHATGAVTVWGADGTELTAIEGLPLTQMLELLDDLGATDFNLHWDRDATRSTCHCTKQRFSDVLEAVLAAH